MNNNLTTTNQNSKLALAKSKSLLDITNKILANKNDSNLLESYENFRFSTSLGHSDTINSVTITPDGKYIVSGSSDESIKLWEISSGKEIRTFTGHKGRVNSVAVTPDGKHIVSGSSDRSIKLWEISSGKEIQTFTEGRGRVHSVFISRDGKYIVSLNVKYYQEGTPESYAIVWDIKRGELVRRFLGGSSVIGIAVSDDLEYIFLAKNHYGDDKYSGIEGTGHINLLNIDSGEIYRTFYNNNSYISSLAISKDSKYLVSGDRDGSICLWEISSGKHILEFKGHKGSRVNSVAISNDNKYVVSCSHRSNNDNTIKLWDLESFEEVQTFEGCNVSVNSVAISDNSKYIVAGCGDKKIKCWNLETGKEIQSFESNSDSVSLVAYSLSGRYIVTNGGPSTIKIFDTHANKKVKYFEQWDDNKISLLEICPNENYILTCTSNDYGHNNYIGLWDLENVKHLKTFSFTGVARKLIFSPNANYIISGTLSDIWNLWRVDNCEEVIRHNASLMAMSYDEKYIAIGSSNGCIELLEVSSGKKINDFSHDDGQLCKLTFTPGGKYIITASFESIKIWELENGKEITSFNHDYREYISSLIVTPNGKYILIGTFYLVEEVIKKDLYYILDDASQINIFDIKSGKKVKGFDNSGNKDLLSMEVTMDGKYIIASYSIPDDESDFFYFCRKLWDIESGESLDTLRKCNAKITRDEKYIITYHGSTIEVDDITTGKNIVSYATSNDGEWLSWNQKHEYNCSNGANKYFHFIDDKKDAFRIIERDNSVYKYKKKERLLPLSKVASTKYSDVQIEDINNMFKNEILDIEIDEDEIPF